MDRDSKDIINVIENEIEYTDRINKTDFSNDS